MPWIQLSLDCDRLDAPRVEQALEQAGAVSVTLRAAADAQRFDVRGAGDVAPPGLWERTRVTGLFAGDVDVAGVTGALRSGLAGAALPEHCVEHLDDRDWVREWTAGLSPMRFGERLWVCPSWLDPPADARVCLRLDPGLAFGTGTHESTRLCLEWLECVDLCDATVVDYGCGSGVLALAALALGARRAVGVDVDPRALATAAENARRNGFDVAGLDGGSREGRLVLAAPAVVDVRDADLLVANILARPLIDLAPRFAGLLRDGGRIALAGLLRAQRATVAAAYAPWFALADEDARGDWILLAGSRRTRAPR